MNNDVIDYDTLEMLAKASKRNVIGEVAKGIAYGMKGQVYEPKNTARDLLKDIMMKRLYTKTPQRRWQPQTMDEAIAFERERHKIREATPKPPSDKEVYREELRKSQRAVATGESTVDKELARLDDLYPDVDFNKDFRWKLKRIGAPTAPVAQKPASFNPIESLRNFLKGQQKSPYAEYPDAFQENGVWKVLRDGQKYRVED